MGNYIIKRVLFMLLTIFVLATLMFFMFRMLPGDPTAQVISPALDPAVQNRLKQAYGLDKPMAVQYALYLKNLVTLKWGRSFTTGKAVFEMLSYRFWNTIFLMAAGLSFTLVVGIGMGMIMAWRRNSSLDVGSTLASLVLQSAPPFVTGILLLMILSYRLDLFPTGGMLSSGRPLETGIRLIASADFWHHLALPALTVAFYYMATPMLIMRDSMLEILGSDFIELAKAKGLSPRIVMVRHAARNALLPVLTVTSVMIGFAIGGQVIVEQVFSWPGMGQLMVQSASSQDYPVAQATFFLLAVVIIVMNLLSDISYCWLDPRIRLGGKA